MGKNYRYELVGAFGDPIDENPTCVMEEAAFNAVGLRYRYLNIRVKKNDIKEAIDGVKAFNFRGINLTIPHKVAAVQYVDELSASAEIIGAINIIVNNEGKLYGENTDGKGYLFALKQAGVDVAGKTMMILGAGGAARAISVESALAGAKKIYIVNGNKERGTELVSLLQDKTDVEAVFVPWKGAVDIAQDVDILSNATSVGLYPNVNDKPNIAYESLRSELIVTDVIFNDPHSLFLQEAEKINAKTINGLGMLAKQGALNFEFWTGVKAPYDLMVETLKKEFNL